jgi:hypothetical protein
MRANVDILPYNDHDRSVQLLHTLDHTVWDGKVEAILDSMKYTTLMVNELFRSSSLLRAIMASQPVLRARLTPIVLLLLVAEWLSLIPTHIFGCTLCLL